MNIATILKQLKGGDTATELSAKLIQDFSVKEVREESGRIQEMLDHYIVAYKLAPPKDVANGLQFRFLDQDAGYTRLTAYDLVKKHQAEVKGKTVLIRYEPPSLSKGTAYGYWGLWVEK